MAALGVTSIDMPKAPMVLTNGIKYLVNLPELRKLNRRVDDSGQPIRKLLKDPAVVRAAYLQTRGKEAAKLCTFYEKGRGPWQSCVVFDGNDKNDFGTCANCRFSKHKHACTLCEFILVSCSSRC